MSGAEGEAAVTVLEACDIVRSVSRPGFHGSVTVNIKDGVPQDVDLRQKLKEKPQTAA